MLRIYNISFEEQKIKVPQCMLKMKLFYDMKTLRRITNGSKKMSLL